MDSNVFERWASKATEEQLRELHKAIHVLGHLGLGIMAQCMLMLEEHFGKDGAIEIVKHIAGAANIGRGLFLEPTIPAKVDA